MPLFPFLNVIRWPIGALNSALVSLKTYIQFLCHLSDLICTFDVCEKVSVNWSLLVFCMYLAGPTSTCYLISCGGWLLEPEVIFWEFWRWTYWRKLVNPQKCCPRWTFLSVTLDSAVLVRTEKCYRLNKAQCRNGSSSDYFQYIYIFWLRISNLINVVKVSNSSTMSD